VIFIEHKEMSIIAFDTDSHYVFFKRWATEVHDKARLISGENDPVYLLYVDDYNDNDIYEYSYEYNVIRDYKHCLIPLDSTPVHCNPPFDMSTTSFAELVQANNCEEYTCAIEDMTICDIIEYCNRNLSKKDLDINLLTFLEKQDFDNDIKSMCMFADLALDSPMILISYIKYALLSRGYMNEEDLGLDTIKPMKYTLLEARSEMMKCNKSLYDAYKQRLLDTMLTSVIEDSRSKAEMEHKLSGLAYEILLDSVVNCMNTLWCFIDGVWQECSTDGYIWNFLTTDFIEYLGYKGEHTEKLEVHMMSITIRSRMMKDIKMRLQDDNFYMLLDSKRNIIRMTNGVYDTVTGILSDPVPSDYVSVVSGVPYQIFDEDSAQIAKLMNILGSIFPDPDILDFFILSCCTFLEGYNSPKVFYIWWGTGNNAKSLVQTLVMKTFGEYCSTAPTSLVTGKRTESSNATPELCHVEKKLVVFLQEPNPDERIKAGKMKEMTGNDSMYVRQLFKSGKTMTLKAKLVIVCNNIIEIPGMDAAIKRRIVVLPFTSTFLDPTEYKARSFKGTLEHNSNIIDLSVEKDLISCKSAFMYVICQRYRRWLYEDNMFLNVPQVIKEVTEEYITSNNYPLKFIRNYMHYVSNHAVAATDVYEMFKEWFRKAYPGKKVQDFEKFTKEISDEGYKSNDDGAILDTFVSYNGDN
jgi:P4 family phage/plasmid primase-like protien